MAFSVSILFFGVVWLALLALAVYLVVLLIRALRKYLRSGEVRQENRTAVESLAKALKGHRERCRMTQEFVAESIGVSRQAVSNGKPAPPTPAPPTCWHWRSCTACRRRNCCAAPKVKMHKRGRDRPSLPLLIWFVPIAPAGQASAIVLPPLSFSVFPAVQQVSGSLFGVGDVVLAVDDLLELLVAVILEGVFKFLNRG